MSKVTFAKDSDTGLYRSTWWGDLKTSTASAVKPLEDEEDMDNLSWEGYYRTSDDGTVIELYDPVTHKVRKRLILGEVRRGETAEEAKERVMPRDPEEIEPWTPILSATDPVGL